VTDDPGVYRLVRAEQRKDGAWIKLNHDTPARVKAGKRLRMRLVLFGPDGVETVPLSFGIPAEAAGQKGKLFLNPGSPFPFEQGPMPTTLKGFTKLLGSFVRTDQFEGRLSFFGPTGSIQRTEKTAPADRVVTGDRRIKVIVE
jgi:hypothetical protein